MGKLRDRNQEGEGTRGLRKRVDVAGSFESEKDFK